MLIIICTNSLLETFVKFIIAQMNYLVLVEIIIYPQMVINI